MIKRLRLRRHNQRNHAPLRRRHAPALERILCGLLTSIFLLLFIRIAAWAIFTVVGLMRLRSRVHARHSRLPRRLQPFFCPHQRRHGSISALRAANFQRACPYDAGCAYPRGPYLPQHRSTRLTLSGVAKVLTPALPANRAQLLAYQLKLNHSLPTTASFLLILVAMASIYAFQICALIRYCQLSAVYPPISPAPPCTALAPAHSRKLPATHGALHPSAPHL